MRQAYYTNTLGNFIEADADKIYLDLDTRGYEFASRWRDTAESWKKSIQLFQNQFSLLLNENPDAKSWTILLEYEIPRLMRRIDAVILTDDLILVIEYKNDRETYDLADIRQAEDYALDLADFHLESKKIKIFPILLSPKAKPITNTFKDEFPNYVHPCLKSNEKNLASIISEVYNKWHTNESTKINAEIWENSRYEPTSTIIQAANALFAGQNVEDISKHGALNLSATSRDLAEIIDNAKETNKKVVCFVTGVPGAGKTLVGLNLVHKQDKSSNAQLHSAYFSGNGPLINVLREALSRDHLSRQEVLYKMGELKNIPKKTDSYSRIKSKIQNLHQFIRDGLNKNEELAERIVVFDEAQRCWNAEHFHIKSKQSRIKHEASIAARKSEAEILFEIMSRREGWAVIIALVGGGQEINTGEGGIGEWGKAIQNHSEWEVYISPQLLIGDSSTSNKKLFKEAPEHVTVHTNENLHLSISQRSFRASNLNEWVNAVLDNEPQIAIELSKIIKKTYPLILSRDFGETKTWLKNQSIGSKRIGLIASSEGLRLRQYGIFTKEVIDEAAWFLNDENDVRSSNHLEIAATEYKIQGLEIDWAGLCWDVDLRRQNSMWDFYYFSGTKWNSFKTTPQQEFLLNTYRVLLTRAREGLIIFVPQGNSEDLTRHPDLYDPIYEYLLSCGMDIL